MNSVAILAGGVLFPEWCESYCTFLLGRFGVKIGSNSGQDVGVSGGLGAKVTQTRSGSVASSQSCIAMLGPSEIQLVILPKSMVRGSDVEALFSPPFANNLLHFCLTDFKKEKHINTNFFAGFSWDWVDAKILFMCFLQVIPYGRKIRSGKTDPVQFKVFFLTGPFLLITIVVLRAVFSS